MKHILLYAVFKLCAIAFVALAGNQNSLFANDKSAKLLELARGEFEEISKEDEILFEKVANGEVADFTTKSDGTQQADDFLQSVVVELPRRKHFDVDDAADLMEAIVGAFAWDEVLTPELFIERKDAVKARLYQEERFTQQEAAKIVDALVAELSASEREDQPQAQQLRQSIVAKWAHVQANHPSNSRHWQGRLLTADRIVWLCTDESALDCVTHHGVRIKGAHFDDEVDLSRIDVPFALSFTKCVFDQEIKLARAKLGSLNLGGCHTRGVSGAVLTTDGSIELNDGFRCDGRIWLAGARIGGSLECADATIVNPGGQAIVADGMQVLDDVRLGSDVKFKDSFKAEGEVRLTNVRVAGQLGCVRGHFVNPGKDKYAIQAAGLQVQGSVYLGGGFMADGRVLLNGAFIGEDLVCSGGHFMNRDGYALSGYRLRVNGGVSFKSAGADERFKNLPCRMEGMLRLTHADIGGELTLAGGEFDKGNNDVAIDARYASVGGILQMQLGGSDGIVDLRSANVASLLDDLSEQSNLDTLNIRLEEFVYRQFDGKAEKGSRARIRWIRANTKRSYSMQPYEQLASVYRRSGNDAAAKSVLVAKNDDLAKYGQLGFLDRLWHYVKWMFIGYGYRPLRTFVWMLLFILIGWWQAKRGHPARFQATADNPQEFNAFMYSVDAFVPVIKFKQVDDWALRAGALRAYFWFHTAMGWFLTGLLVAAMTGLVKK